MEDSSMQKTDVAGFIGLMVVLTAVAVGLYHLITKWNVTKAAKEALMGAPPGKATPGPVNTEAPYSNAPVQGQLKDVITPTKWEMEDEDRTSKFTLPKEAVVRWDLIPVTARSVTIGFRMTNPPLTGRDPKFMKYVISTQPASSGFSVSLPGRGDYKINAAGHVMTYVRDNSAFDMTVETLEVQFTQVSETNTRVQVLYNGKDKVVSDKNIPISRIRMWPQQLRVFDPEKIENVWVIYS